MKKYSTFAGKETFALKSSNAEKTYKVTAKWRLSASNVKLVSKARIFHQEWKDEDTNEVSVSAKLILILKGDKEAVTFSVAGSVDRVKKGLVDPASLCFEDRKSTKYKSGGKYKEYQKLVKWEYLDLDDPWDMKDEDCEER